MVTVPWNAGPAMALILNKSQSAAATTADAANPTGEQSADTEREAQRRAAAQAEFVARISHDIRNPLNAITGFAEAIQSERCRAATSVIANTSRISTPPPRTWRRWSTTCSTSRNSRADISI
jgi:signal transduction histidine kinase